MAERVFPILGDPYLKAIPWELVAPHEAQAQKNHDQSLRYLASRGGLDPTEAYAVINDRKWVRLPVDYCRAYLCAKIWKRKQAELREPQP